MKKIFLTIIISLSMAFSWSEEGLLELPPFDTGVPSAGKRVAVTPSEYQGTQVHHQLYLPPDWDPDWKNKGLSWPVIVEYTGNYYPPSGSTGEVDGAALGYSLGRDKCIWVVFPFISEDHKKNHLMWWGDEKATVEYAKVNVPRICEEFGGNPSKVLICGFSRGAIAVNYIGLFDDEIAKLWCGFLSHDHYDGERVWNGTAWGSPLEEYQKNAGERLKRLQGRPALVCQANESLGGANMVKKFLGGKVGLGKFTFVSVSIKKIFPEVPNSLFKDVHTDCWMFRESPERKKIWEWVDNLFKSES